MRCGKLIGCCALSFGAGVLLCMVLPAGGMVFVLAGGVVAAGVAPPVPCRRKSRCRKTAGLRRLRRKPRKAADCLCTF